MGWAVPAVTATLIPLARPVACLACLPPFGFTWRETAFASWVGLRGAVPVYLTTILLLAGVRDAQFMFSPTFVVVVISLVVQGWTIGPVARLLGFRRGKGSGVARPEGSTEAARWRSGPEDGTSTSPMPRCSSRTGPIPIGAGAMVCRRASGG